MQRPLREGRLADPGVAGHEDEAAPPPPRGGRRAAKLPDLLLAADEPDGSHRAQKVSEPAPAASSSTT